MPARSGGVNRRYAPRVDPTEAPAPQEPQVFVVSDGTGETAAAVVRAALLQFRSPWRLRTFGEVRQESQARRVVDLAAGSRSLVVFTLVKQDVARALRERAGELGVEAVDLLGPLLAKIAEQLRAEPRHEPGLLHGLSDEHYRRVEAVEFAVRHDDGTNPHTLFQAHLVLTGVSRTSKTPLSMFLGYMGHKTANIPLVNGIEPPEDLFRVPPHKIVGLTIDAARLAEIRTLRVASMGAPRRQYADLEEIYADLAFASSVHRRLGCPVLDVSDISVEETALRIIRLVERRGGTAKA